MSWLVVLFFGLLLWMAVSMFKTSRNSKLPEEIKMQRYEAKAHAKGNAGGAIVVGVIIIGVLYAIGSYLDPNPTGPQTATVTTQGDR